jgi:hypothetical protein
VNCLKEFAAAFSSVYLDDLDDYGTSWPRGSLPTEDPVLEQVLTWTVERDARDVRRLLEWLPQARSSRERQALLDRVRDLLDELEQAMSALDELV